MHAVRLIWRADLRRRARTLVFFAAVVMVVVGVTATVLAGARRTASSFDRLVSTTRSQDLIVFADDIRPADVARLRGEPGVAGLGYARQLAVVYGDNVNLAAGGPLDDALFRDVYRLHIVAGRATAPGAADEVVVGEPVARSAGLRVGDMLPLHSFTAAQVDGVIGGASWPKPGGPEVSLRVVGISRMPIDLSLQGTNGGLLLLPRAFMEKYGDRIGNFGGPYSGVLLVRFVDGGAGVAPFLDHLRSVLGPRGFSVDPAALSNGGVQDSIDMIALALLTFGLVAATAGLIALALIAGRLVDVTGADQQTLRDLGLARAERAVAVAGPLALAALLGAALATVPAWAASSLFPVGVARDAEPRIGRRFDVATLSAVALLVAAIVAVVVAVAAWRATRPPAVRTARARRPRFGRWLDSQAVPPAAGVGLRLAFPQGNAASGVPVRSSVAGVVAAILGITAVVVFGSSLDTLTTTPRAFASEWDAAVHRSGDFTEGRVCRHEASPVARDPDVNAVAEACGFSVEVNGRAIRAVAVTPERGAFPPVVLGGRAPAAVDDIGLGAETMRRLHVGIGDDVDVRAPGGRFTYRVVARVVVPRISEPQAVADGAMLTFAGLDRLDDPNDAAGDGVLLVRFRPGADAAAAAKRLQALPGVDGVMRSGVDTPPLPLEVERLRQVHRFPLWLATFLAIVGTIAVAHLLVTSVQRRRRDFAVLKAMGFVRGQVSASVAVQATSVVLTGVVVGTALGIVAGAMLWRAASARVGVLTIVDVPIVTLLGVAVGAVVVANLVAAVPARRARRTRPAVTLRTE